MIKQEDKAPCNCGALGNAAPACGWLSDVFFSLAAFLDSSTLQLFFDLYHSIPPSFSPLVSQDYSFCFWNGAVVNEPYVHCVVQNHRNKVSS